LLIGRGGGIGVIILTFGLMLALATFFTISRPGFTLRSITRLGLLVDIKPPAS